MSGRRGAAWVAAWVAALVVCLGSAAVIVVGSIKVHDLNSTGATTNDALVDASATRAVARQVQKAMTELWSYDYRTLDESRVESAKLGTKAFARQYAGVYDNLDQLAPAQKAVVVATVTQVGVQTLDGDHATAIVFLNQRATKAIGDPSTATARLRVRVEHIGRSWKVAAVDPF